MRILPCAAFLWLAACAGRYATPGAPAPLQLPESITVMDGPTGNSIETSALLQRLADADLVLLGEVHDNGIQHVVRGQLLGAFAARRPAVVFEQFAASNGPIARPAEGESLEAWLDRTGFDRTSWKWPVHQPVVDGAIKYGRSLWGAGISRESLRSVVRAGESAAPDHLRVLLEQTPMDSLARAALDRELVAGHCGQLADSMVPGMRAAQTVRDAAMAHALMSASADGPAWLIAGNGHVRRDFAVPRLLRVTARDHSVLSVGFLERTPGGDEPEQAARTVYDVVIVTPRVARPDPCAGFQVR